MNLHSSSATWESCLSTKLEVQKKLSQRWTILLSKVNQFLKMVQLQVSYLVLSLNVKIFQVILL